MQRRTASDCWHNDRKAAADTQGRIHLYRQVQEFRYTPHGAEPETNANLVGICGPRHLHKIFKYRLHRSRRYTNPGVLNGNLHETRPTCHRADPHLPPVGVADGVGDQVVHDFPQQDLVRAHLKILGTYCY